MRPGGRPVVARRLARTSGSIGHVDPDNSDSPQPLLAPEQGRKVENHLDLFSFQNGRTRDTFPVQGDAIHQHAANQVDANTLSIHGHIR